MNVIHQWCHGITSWLSVALFQQAEGSVSHWFIVLWQWLLLSHSPAWMLKFLRTSSFLEQLPLLCVTTGVALSLALPVLTDVNWICAHFSLYFYFLFHSANLCVSRTFLPRNWLYLDFSIFMYLHEHLTGSDKCKTKLKQFHSPVTLDCQVLWDLSVSQPLIHLACALLTRAKFIVRISRGVSHVPWKS